MPTVIFGQEALSIRRFRQFDAAIQYFKASDEHEREPCIMIAARVRGPNPPIVIIGLSSLDKYFDGRIGQPTAYCEKAMAYAAKDILGLEDRFAVIQLIDALYAMVDDLVRAPPAELVALDLPLGRAIGEAQLRIDGRLIAEHVVRH